MYNKINKSSRAAMRLRADAGMLNTTTCLIAQDVLTLLDALDEAEQETKDANERAWQLRLEERERERDRYGDDI